MLGGNIEKEKVQRIKKPKKECEKIRKDFKAKIPPRWNRTAKHKRDRFQFRPISARVINKKSGHIFCHIQLS
jgi:hypothetical protein